MNRTWKILLVDDDEEDYLLTRIMASAARGAKIQLNWARSYDDGKKTLREGEPFDAVLVDYDLGLYSGIDLIKEFTSQEYPAPFILFTGRGTYEVDLLAMQAGATLYLTKAEANSLLLERAIRYAIERKQSEDALKRTNEELSRVNEELKNELLERERAENALRESEKKYRDLVGNLSEGVWLVDEHGDTLFVNQQMADMLGYTVDEMLGKNLVVFLDEEGKNQLNQDIQRRGQGLREQMERTYITKDGQLVHTLLTTAPIFTKGRFTGTISGVLDITDRKRVNQTLLESEERFRTTVESMLDGLAIFSAIRTPNADGEPGAINDFYYEYINQKGCQLEGCSLEDLIGHTLVELKHPFIQGDNFRRLVGVVETGEPLEFRRVYMDHSADGRELQRTQEVRAFKSGDGLVITWRDTTDQEEIGKRLLKSEQEAREQLSEIESIYQTAPVGLCVLDRDLRFLRVNEKLAEINGYPAEAHLGRTIRELVPGIADQAEALARSVMQNGDAALNIEVTGETPAQPGITRTWLEHWYPLRHDSGEIIGINIVAEEITDRKRKEDELRWQRQQLALAQNAARMGSLDWDMVNNRMAWSADIELLFGLRPGELNRPLEKLIELVAEEDREQVLQIFATGLITGDVEVQFRVIQQASVETWVLIRGSFTYDTNHKPVRFIGIIMDISERIRVENELRESENRTLELIRHAPTGIYEIDPREPRFLSVNDALCRILGYTHDEIMAMNPFDLLDDASKQIFAERIRKTQAGEKVPDAVEYTVITKDGRKIDALLNTNYRYTNGMLDAVLVIAHDITERKRAERALQESEEKFKALFDLLPVGVSILNEQRTNLYANSALAKILDVPIEKIYHGELGHIEYRRADGSRMPQEEIPSVRAFNEQQRVENVEIEVVKEGEKSVWLNVSAAPLPFPDWRVVVVSADITPHKRAEQALRQSEQRLQFQIENSPVAVIEWDADFRITRWAGEAQNIFGWSEAEIVGALISDTPLIYDEDIPIVQGVIQQLTDGVTTRVVSTNRNVTKEGKVIHCEWRNSVFYDDAGKMASVLSLVTDITSQVEVVEALRQKTEELEILLDAIPAFVWIAQDPECRRIIGNRATSNLLSVPSGTNVSISAINEEDSGFVRQLRADGNEFAPEELPIQQAAVLGKPVRDAVVDMHFKDGRQVIILGDAVPLFDAKGDVRGAVGAFKDITELTQIQKSLQDYTAQLKRSNMALEEFAYIASHDLQEPLRKIRSFSSQLKTQYASVLGEDGLDWLERMRNAAQRMEEMIKGLLEYAHLTSAAQPYAPVDLMEVAREALVNLEARVRTSQGRVEIDELPTIKGDQLQIQQLFQNLIGNALKFHRPDVPPVVRLSSQPGSPGFIEICIEDNGIGFDVGMLEQIFHPFQRLHSRMEYEGTGIGLAICRKIVERHGGSITATSVVGEGSTFIVTLPVEA